MKSSFRKILALLLCTALCLSLVPGAWAEEETDVSPIVYDDTDMVYNSIWPNPPEPLADQNFLISDSEVFSSGTYNAALAANYAKTWWNSYNPEYTNYDAINQGDCTNFVSQCLYAGGMNTDNSWRPYTGAWANPQGLADYLVSQGYRLIICPSASQVSVGDVLLYRVWEDPNRTWTHAAICVEANGNSRTVCAHNNPYNSTSWTMGYSKYAVVQLNGTTVHGSEMSSGAGYTIPNGDYIIALASDDSYYLDIDGNDYPAANNTDVALWGSRPDDMPIEDTWTVSYIGDGGFYKICQNGTDMALTVEGSSTANGANVQLYSYGDLNAQKWSISQNGDGSYRIQAKCSGMSLDNANASLSSGNAIRQWQSNDGSGQQWVFIPCSSYTVSYNANGGTGAPGNQSKTHGINLTLSTTKPTHAITSAGSYTVTFNANGGSVNPTSMSAARTTIYTFRNWNTAQNGSGTSYASGGTYSANESVTLYAQWNSSTTTESVTLPRPTRDGYIFRGWAMSSSASSGFYGKYQPNGNITLYAVWESEIKASGTWGNLNWVLDQYGLLTISGNGEMNDFTNESNDAWRLYKDSIKLIQINEGVTSIGKWAFYLCTNISDLTGESSVKSIGDHSFFNCQELKAVTIENAENIGAYAFSHCKKLEEICMSESITDIREYAFWDCPKLAYVNYRGTPTMWNKINFGTGNEDLLNATIQVPRHETPELISVFNLEDGVKLTWSSVDSAEMYNVFRITGQITEDSKWEKIMTDNVLSFVDKDVVSGTKYTYSVNCFGNDGAGGSVGSYKSEAKTITFIPGSNTYKIKYNGNGGKYIPAEQIKQTGISLTLSQDIPVRDDYYFIGWAESSNAGKPDYLPGGSFIKDADTTLYAVWAQPDTVLPSMLTTIGEEAFANCAFRFVALPENTVTIEKNAFANCPNLTYIYIPKATTNIDPDAFSGISNLTILSIHLSTAKTYAQQHGYTFIPIA